MRSAWVLAALAATGCGGSDFTPSATVLGDAGGVAVDARSFASDAPSPDVAAPGLEASMAQEASARTCPPGTPYTCADLGMTCGFAPDGCGGSISCTSGCATMPPTVVTDCVQSSWQCNGRNYGCSTCPASFVCVDHTGPLSCQDMPPPSSDAGATSDASMPIQEASVSKPDVGTGCIPATCAQTQVGLAPCTFDGTQNSCSPYAAGCQQGSQHIYTDGCGHLLCCGYP